MSDFTSFAEVIKAATEDKKRRIVEKNIKREAEVVPLLSELFAAVAKAKTNGDQVKEVSETKTKSVAASVVEMPDIEQLTELITNVEDKATTILAKVAPDAQEKRFLKLFNRLQDDFQTLKHYVESKSSSYSGGMTSGSGEVRVLRMDDVDARNVQDGKMLVWDGASAKFVFADVPTGGGTGGIVGNATINVRQIATSDGAMIISLQLTQMMINGGFELYSNGIRQNKTEYTVDYGGVNIKTSMNVLVGDVIDFVCSATSLAWNTTFRKIATSDGATILEVVLTQIEKNNGYELFINGVRQSKDFYVVTSSGINISSTLQIRAGDILDFQYTQ